MNKAVRSGLIGVLFTVLGACIIGAMRESATLFGLLSTSGFMPHKMCLAGVRWLIAARAISDQTIAVCYAVIPFLLLRVFRTGISIQPTDKEKAEHAIVLLPWFAAFIASCGMTHEMDVITLWFPTYYVDLGIRIMTCIASVGTCIVLRRKIPVLMGIATQADLMMQMQRLTKQVEDLTRAAQGLAKA